ncbi:hypothetical protein MPTK1_6g07610 [Marchantia polymorpha subsp. ruderalis]|uniref:Transmembrane protein n=2 Tax=Marchantia polymorpha TaxID=3197 RepID=A0AAF6BPK5_MARPO|nr:hypothetical protein MARPO_0053s0074 [Marchantia polymorpha]BBN13939.1 hypothetical protein Mp_6g07610 [Marchantia polymorpha subsp. ruderalis]|eukprot:PTQ38140.1 hypothetical protein MARPO_0053s0074 [Marchantia polymorpha]
MTWGSGEPTGQDHRAAIVDDGGEGRRGEGGQGTRKGRERDRWITRATVRERGGSGGSGWGRAAATVGPPARGGAGPGRAAEGCLQGGDESIRRDFVDGGGKGSETGEELKSTSVTCGISVPLSTCGLVSPGASVEERPTTGRESSSASFASSRGSGPSATSALRDSGTAEGKHGGGVPNGTLPRVGQSGHVGCRDSDSLPEAGEFAGNGLTAGARESVTDCGHNQPLAHAGPERGKRERQGKLPCCWEPQNFQPSSHRVEGSRASRENPVRFDARKLGLIAQLLSCAALLVLLGAIILASWNLQGCWLSVLRLKQSKSEKSRLGLKLQQLVGGRVQRAFCFLGGGEGRGERGEGGREGGREEQLRREKGWTRGRSHK